LLVYSLLPNGSMFTLDPAAPATPEAVPTAKRGSLLFIHKNHVFVVAIELAERITKRSRYNLSKETEDKVLQERLFKMASVMELLPGKTPVPPAKP
jgi:hypothetical protein